MKIGYLSRKALNSDNIHLGSLVVKERVCLLKLDGKPQGVVMVGPIGMKMNQWKVQ